MDTQKKDLFNYEALGLKFNIEPETTEEERRKKIEEREDLYMMYGIHPCSAID